MLLNQRFKRKMENSVWEGGPFASPRPRQSEVRGRGGLPSLGRCRLAHAGLVPSLALYLSPTIQHVQQVSTFVVCVTSFSV